ncbi:MAG: hypothetical protein LBV12_03760 [Puniceicoccales bacterium]|jgi:T5SS/PEP-CTERM-associated repeat protein|nr:hypothetical protein [Puniceicoccales bacterium]
MKKSKFVICATMTVFPMLLTQATSWTNSGTGDWTNTLNWDSGVPDGWKETNIKNGGTSMVNNGETVSGAKVSIGGVNESSLIINEGTLNAVWSVWIAEETGTKGYLQINGGKITNGNDNNFIVGRAGEGTLEANGTAQIDADWSFIGGEVIGTTTQANGTGLMTLNDSSFLNDRKGIIVGAGETSFGALIVNGNSRAISAGVFYVGHFGGGEAYLYDNALASASEIRIANGVNSTGKVVIDNGRMETSSHLLVGVSGDGELIMDGGSVSASSGNAFLGRNANSNGSMTVNDGSFQTNILYIGYSGTGSTTINAGTVTASGTT